MSFVLKLVSEAGQLFASSLDAKVTSAALAGWLAPRIGDWCVVDLVDEHGSPQPVALTHMDARKVEALRELRRKYPPARSGSSGGGGGGSGFADALRFGKSQVVLSDEIDSAEDDALEQAEDAAHRALLAHLGTRTLMFVPLQARGRMLGVITLAMAESGRSFADDDVQLVEEIAQRASMAIDNARLFAAERAARRDLEVVNQRLRILSDASRAFSKSSRDIEALLALITRTMVDALGDTASINLIGADGATLEQVSLTSRFPEIEERIRNAPHVYNQMRVGHGVLGRVALYGEPLFLPVLDKEHRTTLQETVHPEYREVFDKLTATSLMVVPLRSGAADRVTGCASVARARGLPFDRSDLDLFLQLADRAGLALENAELYTRALRRGDG